MSEDGVERRGFRLTGRVQGVGFRWWTRQTAQQLDLAGTVRNRRDGSVEIHARGRGDDLETFSRRIREGPNGARVEGVEEIEAKASLPDDFRIVR